MRDATRLHDEIKRFLNDVREAINEHRELDAQFSAVVNRTQQIMGEANSAADSDRADPT